MWWGGGKFWILDFFFLPFFSIFFLKDSCWFWYLGNLDEWMEHSGFWNKRSTCITQPQTFHEYFHLWHKVPLSPSCLQRQNTVMNPRVRYDVSPWLPLLVLGFSAVSPELYARGVKHRWDGAAECKWWVLRVGEYCCWKKRSLPLLPMDSLIMCCFLSCYFVQLDSS